jgi:hypothetical protein
MVYVNLAPVWFFGFDIMLELVFAIICLMVSFFAFKLYKESNQRLIKLFSLSFLLISISYFVQSIINFLILSKINENICSMLKFHSVLIFNQIGMLIHVFFLTIGLSILFYTTLKDKRKKILWFLIIISLVAVFFSKNYFQMFYLIATIYLGFISIHYIQNYLKIKKIRILLVTLAFILLFFGHIHFLIMSNSSILYVIGHFLELIAYIFILINLYLVMKK